MMNYSKFTALVLLFVFACKFRSFAQDNICICASYSSLKFQTDYESLFPHKIIQREKIKQVIVYTNAHTTSDSTKKLLSEKYIEQKFNFDENGRVCSRIFYYMGKANDIEEFERNTKGLIIKKTFTYVDSLERKLSVMPPKLTEYTYDNSNRMIKEKESDYSGKFLPDAQSTYTEYKYDSDGRLVETNGQMFFDGDNIWKNTSSFQYSKENLQCVHKSIQKGELSDIDTSIYANGKLLSEVLFNTRLNDVAFRKSYRYNTEGKLIFYEQKNGAAGGSECPDKGTYTDQYFYSANGLVEKVINSYGIYNCVMTIQYLK